ncbi:MAG: hypothetical protein ED557_04860 [Balneola sp.]|nr:MAG: hypothetical protein ED557_04860 [Balneola sp.]
MKKYSLSLFALVVALFVSNCGGGDPLIDPIKAGLNSQNYEQALAMADTAIMKDPTNGTPHYYKAVVYNNLAKLEANPNDRTPLYEKMRSSLMEARAKYDVAESPAAEANEITPLILDTWELEHNEGIKYATVDSVMESVDAPLSWSIAHLNNATTINPDSVLSFDVIAQIYYMNQEPAKAAESITTAINLQETAAASEYDRLGSYYFLSQQPENAVTAIEEGLEIYPDSVFLIEKLADGLFQIDQTDKALSVMDRLIQNDPGNARYHLVIGTRVYQRVLSLSDQVTEARDQIFDLERNDGSQEEIDALNERIETLEAEMQPLTDRAESELLEAAELDDTIPSTFNTLGILYQNNSAALFDKRNNTVDNDEAEMFDTQAREEATKAMQFYEKAAELDPDNTSYWNSLFRIYTLLDMREEAEEAMKKAGM